MEYAASAQLRRTMYLAYHHRAYPTNVSVLRQLLQARHVATALGYRSLADLVSADMMIGSATKTRTLLNEMDTASRERAKREFDLLQSFVHSRNPSALPLSALDGRTGRSVSACRLPLRLTECTTLLSLQLVGDRSLANSWPLLSCRVRPAKAVIVWDKSVNTYDVYDFGEKVGRVYLDMLPRD